MSIRICTKNQQQKPSADGTVHKLSVLTAVKEIAGVDDAPTLQSGHFTQNPAAEWSMSVTEMLHQSPARMATRRPDGVFLSSTQALRVGKFGAHSVLRYNEAEVYRGLQKIKFLCQRRDTLVRQEAY